MINPIYNGNQDVIIELGEGFRIPLFSKETQYHSSTHVNRQKKKRSKFNPLSFTVPLRIWNDYNRMSLNEVQERVAQWLYSKEPAALKIPGTSYYFIGEFDGVTDIQYRMIAIDTIEVTFTSEYSHKFYDGQRTQQGSTITISTKTQIPTIPLIELTGLTGNDVQISNSKADGSFKRIRLTAQSGSLPSALTIDPANETIFTTSTGTERLDLLRIDSNFEDFDLEHDDVVTVNQGIAKLTYKELML